MLGKNENGENKYGIIHVRQNRRKYALEIDKRNISQWRIVWQLNTLCYKCVVLKYKWKLHSYKRYGENSCRTWLYHFTFNLMDED